MEEWTTYRLSGPALTALAAADRTAANGARGLADASGQL